MKILCVDPGFSTHYAYDVYTTLVKDFRYLTRQISPQNLTPALIQSFHPDVLLVLHGSITHLPLVRYAKAQGATTVLWLVEDPYEIDHHRGKMVNAYDFVFTNEKCALNEYPRPNVYYLPWCCNPHVHRSMPVPPKYKSDLCFVGMGFSNRIRIMNAIEPWIHNLNVKLIGDWQMWGAELHPNLKRFVIPVINDFLEIPKYYNGAKINLNIHRDPVDPPYGNSLGIGAFSPNDRTFVLAGCGAFQLLDRGRCDVWECFVNGVEMVGFDKPDDLAQKIHFYLDNPQIREGIGRAAQKKAYAQHTFKHRLAEIFRIIGHRAQHRNNNVTNTFKKGQIQQTFRSRPSGSQYNPNINSGHQ